MKKVMLFMVCILTLNSCLTTGAPHGHIAESIDEKNSKIKLRISCQPNSKYYTVSGFEKNDSLYITSRKMKGQENKMIDKKFLCISDSVKSYRLRIGDHNFHRKLLNDTVEVKVVKPDSSYKIYKFLIIKDSYIRN